MANKPLTQLRKEVLHLLHLQNKEIAKKLGISLRNVEFHIETSFRETGCFTRAELAVCLERVGFFQHIEVDPIKVNLQRDFSNRIRR